MDITIILKIVVVAITVAIVNQLLQKAGKEEYTLIITIAGLVIALMMFLPALLELKDELFSMMSF
ncbi:MAG: stage III sporulation protein AC [Clostridia bacterium]|jgi:stage III sporulation protein AC|nr:stage III sporulation protein AC [Clostridia bacterium]